MDTFLNHRERKDHKEMHAVPCAALPRCVLCGFDVRQGLNSHRQQMSAVTVQETNRKAREPRENNRH
jgi:hypothetical protein